MNIFLDTNGTTSTVKNTFEGTKAIQFSQSTNEVNNECGYSLDIADKVMDNGAYGHGTTTEEIMQVAQNTDAQVQKDFMVVMSNTVSGEDYSKMVEDGFDAGSTDVETYVSIVDQIKVTLAKAGVEIQGYTDNVDLEKIAEILGNISSANALVNTLKMADLPITNESIEDFDKLRKQASNIQGLSDDALKYMIINKKTPSIENLYIAQFSSAKSLMQSKGYFGESIGNSGMYFAKKAEGDNTYGLEGQIEKVIKEANLEVNEETIEQGKWLILSGIECNKENLIRLSDLDNIKFPISEEELVDLTVEAIKEGIEPKRVSLVQEEGIEEKAKRIYEEVNSILDTSIEKTIEKNEQISIKNLYKNTVDEDNTKQEIPKAEIEKELKVVQAKADLEEIRLMMSVEANKELLKKGIQIDTIKLSKLVDELKKEVEGLKARLYQGEDQIDNEKRESTYKECIEKTNELKNMPSELIGMHYKDMSFITLNKLHEEGTMLQKHNDKIDKIYEPLMTKPRSDLGDKISKAFRNVDDILEDMELPVSEENRRAIRILGYNSMEITEENIQAVKEADLSIQRVIKRMNPANTLDMIRNQKNPLEMTIEEINSYLDEKNENNGQAEEKFSRFLQKLDKAKKITEEEKKAYKGIYRLFRQIEKSDGAAVGNLVNSKKEINFKNMLSAVRTGINKKIDISIDEEFGALEKLIQKNSSISKDINQAFDKEKMVMSEEYYGTLAGEITTQMSKTASIEGLRKIEVKEETTIEEFSEALFIEPQVQKSEQAAVDFNSFREGIKEANEAEDAVIERLIDMDLPISIDNITAMNEIIGNHGIIFKDIFKEIKKDITDELKDSKSAKKAYSELLEEAKAVVHEKADFSNNYIDVNACKSMCKILSFANKMAKKDSFMIPVEIDGEDTLVNLDIYHDSKDKGKISITMETEKLGRIGAWIDVKEQNISGMIVYEKKTSKDTLMDISEALEKEISNSFKGEMNLNVGIVQSEKIDFYSFGEDRNPDSAVSTKDLYVIAKSFLKALKKGNINEN